ncbi:Vacuolar ATPase assembly integral membrane protein VMA21 [Hypsizygus marmoreus]|uniref:Vacuolar ATPase assembly integral membrane protein VMA21 n=1 Tax=Hypsizygus marmoreus TaxID=39966 RepID=A0A369JQQ6_HYPMA|nr:Vacuolar ATPase assembly integral membrane protein VMA21 [Hypsizygus marmoreus]
MSEQAAVGKVNTNLAARTTLIKLFIFSVSLGIVPISSYFGSLKYVWNGNATFAAITAVVSANVVLVAYIISSLLDDRQTASVISEKTPLEAKKKQ